MSSVFDASVYDGLSSVQMKVVYFYATLIKLSAPAYEQLVKEGSVDPAKITLKDVAKNWMDYFHPSTFSFSGNNGAAISKCLTLEYEYSVVNVAAVSTAIEDIRKKEEKPVVAAVPTATGVVVPDDRDVCSVHVEPKGANVTSAGDENTSTSSTAPCEESVVSSVVAPVVVDDASVASVTLVPMGGCGATSSSGASCETTVAPDATSPYPPTADVEGWAKNLSPAENKKQVADAFEVACASIAAQCGCDTFSTLIESIPTLGHEEVCTLFGKFAFIENFKRKSDSGFPIKFKHDANTKDFGKVYVLPEREPTNLIQKVAYDLLKNAAVSAYFTDSTYVRNAILFVIEFALPLVLVPLLERMNAIRMIKYTPLETDSGVKKYGCIGYSANKTLSTNSAATGNGRSAPVYREDGPRGIKKPVHVRASAPVYRKDGPRGMNRLVKKE